MNVGVSNIDSFYESYYERKVQQLREKHEQGVAMVHTEKEKKLMTEEKAVAGVKDMFGGSSVEVTLSEEGKRRYEAMGQVSVESISDGYGILMDPTRYGAFELEEMDRWNVFDDYLSHCGYYDTIGKEDIEKLRETMRDVLVKTSSKVHVKTDEVLGTASIWSGSGGRELYSYEAALEVESSTAALHFFSDKYLQGEQKSGFDALIDKYYDTVSKDLEGYKSAEEKLNESIYNGRPIESDEVLRRAGLSDQQIKTNKINIRLGGVKHTKEEENTYRNALKQMFSSINMENLTDIFERLEELVIDYASGNSKDREVREVVKNNTQSVRDNVRDYWERLLQMNL